MTKLLSREKFEEVVLERFHGQCCFCSKPAIDAHHIFDRKLYEDGGYYEENGAPVCEKHLKLSDANICRVMDVVLGFLCERGLIWLGSTPDYRFLPAESGGPLLSLTYRLDVSHEDAARLNGEMIDRLVAADLDSCGLIASLQGTTSKATQAVALA